VLTLTCVPTRMPSASARLRSSTIPADPARSPSLARVGSPGLCPSSRRRAGSARCVEASSWTHSGAGPARSGR
jgi:hypothetical protein